MHTRLYGATPCTTNAGLLPSNGTCYRGVVLFKSALIHALSPGYPVFLFLFLFSFWLYLPFPHPATPDSELHHVPVEGKLASLPVLQDAVKGKR